MKIEYFPNTLSSYKVDTLCPFCYNHLNIYDQYIYTKTFKDECPCCIDQPNESIYCLCNNNYYYEKCKIIYCNNCHKNKETKNEKYEHKYVNVSYKELYKLARSMNIKNRSVMNKEELYNAIYQYCTL